MKAINRRREHTAIASALADERLLELIYAVLPAWGMHRMGKQAAKVGDFARIVESLRAQRAALEQLWPLRITTLAPDDVGEAAQLAWQVIRAAGVGTSATQIVAGSKFLHHLLPDLVPPIDREYTFSFFTNQRMCLVQGAARDPVNRRRVVVVTAASTGCSSSRAYPTTRISPPAASPSGPPDSSLRKRATSRPAACSAAAPTSI
jgi:hypothetical protein